MERRGISDGVVRQVLESADTDRRPAEVVTVYRTTRLSKCWREAP
jgi:hypothetical protein